MRTNRAALSACLAVVLMTAAPVSAAQLKTACVPADAGWVLHGDLQRLKQTDVGACILEELRTGDMERKIGAFKVMFGFDPRDDLRDVTLYGRNGDRDEGVAIFRGRFNTDQLVTLIRGNASYAADTHARHTIHRWHDDDKGKLMYGCVVDDDTIIVSGVPAMLRKGLDVMDGEQPSAAAAETFADALPDTPASLVLAVRDIQSMTNATASAHTLRRASTGNLVIGETDGEVKAELCLRATNAEDAVQLSNVVRGIVAFALLNEEKRPEAAELAKRVRIDVDDRTTLVTLAAPSRELIASMQAAGNGAAPDTTDPTR